MKVKRYTEEQIIRILREVGVGGSVVEVCRKHGMSEATVHRWRRKYRGMDQSQLRRLRELEMENARLKKIVAEQAVDINILKDLLGKG